MKTPQFLQSINRSMTSLKHVFAYSVLLCAAVVLTFAQGNGVSAGGKWTQMETEDKMTGAKKVKFSLQADHPLEGDAQPEIAVFCVGGKWKLSDFRPNLRVARPNRISFTGRPQTRVLVRVDNTHKKHNWNWVNGDFFSMDEDTTRQMLGSNIFKIEFQTDRGPQIAEFSPFGINLGAVKQACGLKPQKP